MQKCYFLIVVMGFLFYLPEAKARQENDSLTAALSLNYSVGAGIGEDFMLLRQRINPAFSLFYKSFELGLGCDYYYLSQERTAELRRDNYLSFTPFLRYYPGKKDWFYLETYARAGYYWSKGYDPVLPDGFQTFFGLGAGLSLHPKALDKYKFWRNVDFTVSLRQDMINLDSPVEHTDLRIGIVYKF